MSATNAAGIAQAAAAYSAATATGNTVVHAKLTGNSAASSQRSLVALQLRRPATISCKT